MARARVTLVVNGKRHALPRVGTYSGDIRFVRAFRTAPPSEPWPYLVAELHAVHTYKCRTGRWNSRKNAYDTCTCGAQDMLRGFVKPPARKRGRK